MKRYILLVLSFAFFTIGVNEQVYSMPYRMNDPNSVFTSTGFWSNSMSFSPITLTTSPVVYQDYPDPYRGIDTSLKVGRTEGTATVSPLGAVTYQIPIKVMDGVNQLQPQITVSYNSQSSNSIMGQGWNLSATSSIVRVGKSYYYDNVTDEIKLNNTDNLMLDGKRLILVSGSNLVSGTYETEVSDYSTIECKYINSRYTFLVKAKNGYQYEYGTTDDSYIQAQNSNEALYWLLSKVSDNNGNYMTYEYEKNTSNGEFYLKNINYTGNASANTQPSCSVELTYESRSDIITSYVAGNAVSQKLLLTGIKNINNGSILKEYKFKYSFDNYYSKLTEIEEYGLNGAKYNSTIIDWGDYQEEYSKNANEYFSSINVNREGIYPDFADFDGDGKTDMMAYPTKTPSSAYTSSDVATLYLAYNYYGDVSFSKKATLPLVKDFLSLIYADLNGDGTMDVIRLSYVGKNNYRCDYFMFNGTSFTNSGKGFNTSDSGILVGDFNGDGKTEVLAKGNKNLYNENGTVIASGGIDSWGSAYVYCYANNCYMTDFNGDGKTDILVMDGNSSWVYTLNGSSFSRISSFNNTDLKNWYFTYPGDFNGDGKTDILCQQSSNTENVYIFFSTGQSFIKKQIYNHDIKAMVFVADCNHDGKSEIIHGEVLSGNKWKMKVGTFNGESFINESYISSYIDPTKIKENASQIRQSNVAVADFDGDGRAEFLFAGYSDMNIIFSFADKQNLLVKTIVDGFGQQVGFEYAPITQSGYSKSEGSTSFPIIKSQFPLYVASSMTNSGAGAYKTLSYKYKDLYLHRQGKGIVCFGEITETDYSKKIRSISTYNHSGSAGYIPYLSSKIVETTDSERIYEENYSYSFPSPGGVRREQQLTHTSTSDKLRGTTESVYYSAFEYGNPKLITKSIDDVSVREDRVYKNVITDSKRLLGLPLTIQTSTTRSNKNTWVDKTAYTYDSNNRVSKKESFVNNEANKVSEESFLYNNFGHITSRSVKPYSSTEALTTSYKYSANGRFLEEMTDPMGFKTIYTYHSSGLLQLSNDYKNHSTLYEYDDMGNLIKTTYPDNIIETNELAWNQTVSQAIYSIKKTSTNNPTTITLYNCLGKELRNSVTQFNGEVISIDKVYDSSVRLQKESLPFSGNSATLWNNYEYDGYDRPVKISYASGKVTSYNYSGKSTSETKDGITTTKTIDGTNNVTSVSDPSGTITYTYLSNGNPESIKIADDIETTFSYDEYGRKTALNDPSAGKKEYAYDKYGYVNKETDAEGRSVSYTFDEFGKMLTKTTDEFNTNYSYNSDHLLTSAVSNNGTSSAYTYDSYGNVLTEKELAPDGIWLQKSYTYVNGRVMATTYQSQNESIASENYLYANGHLKSVKLSNNTLIWDLQAIDNFGNPTKIVTGNVTRNYTYNSYGIPTGRNAGSTASGTFMNSSYDFNPSNGNLTSRKDINRNLSEDFLYDDMNRLTGYKDATIAYSPIGNILSKSDAGSMSYNKYALNEITPVSNIPSSLLRTQQATYTSFMRPNTITENSYTAQFTYNSDYQRIKMAIKDGNNNYLTRYYLGGVYEIDQKVGADKEKLYLGGDYYSASSVYVKQNGTWKLYYICRDYLGSITHITDDSGSLTAEYSYDAWGRLRNPVNQTVYDSGSEPELFLDRGYTGHEHLAIFGLINMNARLYDPVVGRFLSPDPYVQLPDNLQNFNRYAYGLNNPLRYVDENGECIWLVVGAVVGAYIGGVSSNQGELNPLQWDYKSASTYLGIGIGALGGYVGAYGITNPGTVTFVGGISTPYVSAGVAVGATGSGTDWKYDFHWTTSAGGGGSIGNTDYSSSERKVDEAVYNAGNSWNYNAYSYASSSLLLLADDASGAGVIDDVLIPAAYGVATFKFAYDNGELIAKQAREIAQIAKRSLTLKQGFTYELQATRSGYYPNVRGGKVYLNQGEVWKYGETTKGFERYPKRDLEDWGVYMKPIYYGNTIEIKIQEKIMIYGYAIKYGTLPPGNRIFR